MTIPITLFTVSRGHGNATKSFKSDAQGLPIKDVRLIPYISKGRAKTVYLEDLQGLGNLFKSLEKNQCLGYGIMNDGDDTERNIVASKHLRYSGDNAVSRTKAFFPYPKGKAIAYFDFDGDAIDWYENECKENPNHFELTPPRALEIICDIIPEFKSVQVLVNYSASSCFKSKATKEWVKKPKSFHLYFVVNDGVNIPLLKDLILKRLWLAGYGYIQLSKPSKRDGVKNRLVRCIIDYMVFQGERIDFAAGAQYLESEPFYQDLPEPVLLGGNDALSVASLPQLTDRENSKFENMRRGKLGAYKKAVEMGVSKIIKKKNPTIPEAELKQQVQIRISNHNKAILKLSDVINFSNGKQYTIKSLLSMPLDINGKHPLEEITCADPDEPDYNNGVCAYFNWNDGKPNIISFAHGGRTYKIEREDVMNNVVKIKERDAVSENAKAFSTQINVESEDFLHDRIIPSIDALVNANTDLTFLIYRGDVVTIEKNGDESCIVKTDAQRISYELSKVVRFYRRTSERIIGVSPPSDVVSNVMTALIKESKIPEIKRIATVPQYTAQGKLLLENEIDAESGVYLLDNEMKIRKEEIIPTPENLQAARNEIDDLLIDFPFISDADKHNAIAMLILPFVRDMIPGPTPLHLFTAPEAGTGKSLLNKVIAKVFDPFVAHTTFAQGKGNDGGVMAQKLFTICNSGDSHGWFDNLTGELDCPELDGVLTGTYIKERGFHTQNSIKAKVRQVWSITANNLGLTNDTLRRTIEIRINRQSENPAGMDIDYKHKDLEEWVMSNRQDIVTAVLILVENWIQLGKPSPERLPFIGSFEEWRNTIGGIMESAGYDSLLGNINDTRSRASDNKYQDWLDFAERWYEDYPNEWVLPKELVSIVQNLELNESIFYTKTQTSRGLSSTIGHKLKDKHEKMYSDLCILKGEKYKRPHYLIYKVGVEEPAQL